MPNRPAATRQPPKASPRILEVAWYSGIEQLDIDKILACLDSPTPMFVQTLEARKNGEGFVQYQPQVTRVGKGTQSFTLTYRNGGNFIADGLEGEEAGGEHGSATYLQSADGKWTCSWQTDGNSSATAEPECTWADEASARLVQACLRSLRDPTFRKRILDRSGRCVITNETNSLVLEAAHVLGVGNGGNDHDSNGLILRRDLHALFDAHVLRLDSEGVFSMKQVPTSYAELFSVMHKLDPETLGILKDNINRRNDLIVETP